MSRLFPPSDTRRFTTSWLLPPLILGCIRLIFSTYIFTYLLYRIAYSAVNDGGLAASQSFSYFTNITYWSLGFYFAFAGVHTVFYSLRGKAPLDRWGVVLQFLHAVLYSSVVTFPFQVSVVYWVILAPDDGPFNTAVSGYSNVSAHLLNSLFALFEIAIPRTDRPPWVHILFLILFLAGYLCVAYITKATKGFYTYNFLNPSKGKRRVAGYCFGVLAAIIIVFCLVWLLVWGRLTVTEKVLRMKGKFSKRDLGSKEVGGERGEEKKEEKKEKEEKEEKEEVSV